MCRIGLSPDSSSSSAAWAFASSKATGSILGTILPLLMVVMLGVGAFYPAVDLAAGEKEVARKTVAELEALAAELDTPAPLAAAARARPPSGAGRQDRRCSRGADSQRRASDHHRRQRLYQAACE